MGIGHGAWCEENAPKLLELFKKAVLEHGKSIQVLNPEAKEDGDAVDKVLETFGPDHVVCVQRIAEKDAAGNLVFPLVLTPGKASVLGPDMHKWCGSPIQPDFEVDGFPGASIMHPMGEVQWHQLCFSWITTACLRFYSMMTVATVNVDLWRRGSLEDNDEAISSRAFIILSAVSLILEVVAALIRTDRVQSCDNLASYFCGAILRFLGMSHPLIGAPRDAFTSSKRLQTTFKTPILVNISQTARQYELRNGVYSLLPKIFLEDLMMATLKVLLAFQHREKSDLTVALTLCVISALFGSFLSLFQMYKYLTVLSKYESEMDEHLRVAGKDFERDIDRFEKLKDRKKEIKNWESSGLDPFGMAGRRGILKATLGKFTQKVLKSVEQFLWPFLCLRRHDLPLPYLRKMLRCCCGRRLNASKGSQDWRGDMWSA